MFLVGLTGGIASGKSTVSDYFRQWKIPVVDADSIARQVVEPGKPAWSALRNAFGDEYFDSASGVLDRKKLGTLIFGNAELRRKLNSIVHPYIRWEIAKAVFFNFLSGHQFTLLDLPLLYESGWQGVLQFTIVVSCSEQTQLERIETRDGASKEEAMNRIKVQLPLTEKEKRATFVIDNNGDLAQTRTQAGNICGVLRSSRLHWLYRFVGVVGVLCVGGVLFGVGKALSYATKSMRKLFIS